MYDVETWEHIDSFGVVHKFEIKLYIEHYDGQYEAYVGADNYGLRYFVIGVSDSSATLDEFLDVSLDIINDFNDFKDAVLATE